MTEYWVSQKQHFCEYCKIFIANNAASKGMHENGTRHKENVAKRLADMRKRNVVEKREKEQMERDLERIEWKAQRQYQKDLAEQSGAVPSGAGDSEPTTAPQTASGEGWVLDEKTGYYFDPKTKYTYDPNSGLYYTELTGRWTTQEEAVLASQEGGKEGAQSETRAGGVQEARPESKSGAAKAPELDSKLPGGSGGTGNGTSSGHGGVGTVKKVAGGGKVPVGQKVAGASSKGKGVASSLAVKRKREGDVPKAVTAEEAAALAAREAAKKRLEDRTKKNYGFTFS